MLFLATKSIQLEVLIYLVHVSNLQLFIHTSIPCGPGSDRISSPEFALGTALPLFSHQN